MILGGCSWFVTFLENNHPVISCNFDGDGPFQVVLKQVPSAFPVFSGPDISGPSCVNPFLAMKYFAYTLKSNHRTLLIYIVHKHWEIDINTTCTLDYIRAFMISVAPPKRLLHSSPRWVALQRQSWCTPSCLRRNGASVESSWLLWPCR